MRTLICTNGHQILAGERFCNQCGNSAVAKKRPIKSVGVLAASLGIIGSSLFASHYAAGAPQPTVSYLADTRSDVVKLRVDPSCDAAVLATLPQFSEVSVHKISNGWVQISYGTKVGWIFASYTGITGGSHLHSWEHAYPRLCE